SPASSPSKARALSRRSGLQRATNDLFGGRRRLIDALQQAHDFRGFVSKRDERAESFAVRALTALRGNGRRGGRKRARELAERLDPVTHLDHEPFARLTADAGNANERIHVLSFDAGEET